MTPPLHPGNLKYIKIVAGSQGDGNDEDFSSQCGESNFFY
jgi:hypothetical protein